MKTLYDRLAEAVAETSVADSFSDRDYDAFLSSLEEAVKAWLRDGANSISREG